MRFETRRQLQAKIRRSAWEASSVLGVAGVAAALSIVLLPAAAVLIALSVATLVTGLATAALAPLVAGGQGRRCPLCGTTSCVNDSRRWWHCDGCGQPIARSHDRVVAFRTILGR